VLFISHFPYINSISCLRDFPFECYAEVDNTGAAIDAFKDDTLTVLRRNDQRLERLHATNITLLPASEFFTRYPNIVRFYASVGATMIPKDHLTFAVNLKYLNFSSNQIPKLTSRVFSEAIRLETIVLTSNWISEIEDEAFENLVNLKSLYLNENRLTALKKGTFSGTPNIQQIYLNRNLIDEIEDGTFDLPELLVLGLRHNNLKTLSDRLLANVPKLGLIDISSNQLTQVGNAFVNCLQLSGLFLNNNTQLTVNLHTLGHLPKLNGISLNGTGFSFGENQLQRHSSESVVKILNLLGNQNLYQNFSETKHLLVDISHLFPNIEVLYLNIADINDTADFRKLRELFPHLKILFTQNRFVSMVVS